MATSGAISDDEYAVLCGAIFICLLLCSIFVLAGFISRSAHRDEHAAPLSAERLRAFVSAGSLHVSVAFPWPSGARNGATRG